MLDQRQYELAAYLIRGLDLANSDDRYAAQSGSVYGDLTSALRRLPGAEILEEYWLDCHELLPLDDLNYRIGMAKVIRDLELGRIGLVRVAVSGTRNAWADIDTDQALDLLHQIPVIPFHRSGDFGETLWLGSEPHEE